MCRQIFLVTLLVLMVTPSVATAQGGAPPIVDPGEPDPIVSPQPCPEYSERAETYLKNYLSLPGSRSRRENAGVDHLERSDVATVTDEEVCGHIIHELNNNVMIQGDPQPDGVTRHILQAGNYYFVEYLRDYPDGQLYFDTGPTSQHIFRQDYTVVYSWAPPEARE